MIHNSPGGLSFLGGPPSFPARREWGSRMVKQSSRTSLTLVISICSLTFVLPACNNTPTTTEPESTPTTKTTTKGPVTLTVATDKPTISIADRLNLTITFTAEPDVTVRPPAFGTELGQFVIRDFRDHPQTTDPDKSVWKQTYTLEVFFADTYTIPAIAAEFTDNRDPDNPKESTIESEPFDIEVTSLMEGDFDPTQFRDVKAPVELPTDPNLTAIYYGLAIFAAAFILILVIIKLINRQRKPYVSPPIPAHEWAFDQLRRLVDAKLVENGQTHEFYFRLSMILREYIERRFNLMAPERTTEEFLDEMRTTDKLSHDHKSALGDFLAACDRVKYALYEPTTDEIENVFNTARDFVTQTIPHPTASAEKEAA